MAEEKNITGVWDMVIEEMRSRDKIGWERYGKPLDPHDSRDMLREHMDELLDGIAYIRAEIEKKRCLLEKVSRAHALCAGNPQPTDVAEAASLLSSILNQNPV